MCLPATYPLGYASVAPLPAALLDDLFEQPEITPLLVAEREREQTLKLVKTWNVRLQDLTLNRTLAVLSQSTCGHAFVVIGVDELVVAGNDVCGR